MAARSPAGRAEPLPGPGPAWFGSVMGTGILATLLQLHSATVPAAGPVAAVVLAAAWVLLLGLTGGFVRSILRDPGEWRRSAGDPSLLPLWGTVSMGLVSVGSATVTVLPARAPGFTGVATAVDAVLWVGGTALGLATAWGFAAWLLARRPEHPLPTWALPMVPPMVSATAGAGLARRIDAPGLHALVLVVCAACFVVAWVLGVVVIAVAYHHAWRRAPIPVPLSPSTWIPLGIVGQSTAAAQVLARESGALESVARGYGVAALSVGVLVGGYALVVTVRGFLARMPFQPGWWSMTFPVGTCSLGAYQLGWTGVSLALLAVLCGTWTLCAVASVRAVAAAS